MPVNEIFSRIIMGEYDDGLDILKTAIRERQQILTQQKNALLKSTLNKNDRVTFVKGTRPKYLAGVGATVQKVNPKKVVVKVDDWQPGMLKGSYYGKTLNCPLDILEV